MEQPTRGPWRENFLAIALTLFFGAVSLVTMIFVGVAIFQSFSAIFFVFVGAFLILFLGYVHYVVWGYGLSQDVAEQREHEEARRRAELKDQERIRREQF